MQSNGSGMNPKVAIYATVSIVALLRLLFAGLLYVAALDSKTMYISYALVISSATIIGLTVNKLFTVFTFLRKMSRTIE